jgi:hypothetical protein
MQQSTNKIYVVYVYTIVDSGSIKSLKPEKIYQ